jgi:hypothetical protein
MSPSLVTSKGGFVTSTSWLLETLGAGLDLRGSVLVDKNSLLEEVLELILELEVIRLAAYVPLFAVDAEEQLIEAGVSEEALAMLLFITVADQPDYVPGIGRPSRIPGIRRLSVLSHRYQRL